MKLQLSSLSMDNHPHVLTASHFRETLPSVFLPHNECHSLQTPEASLQHTVSQEHSHFWAQEADRNNLSLGCSGNFTVLLWVWLLLKCRNNKRTGLYPLHPASAKCSWPLSLTPVPTHMSCYSVLNFFWHAMYNRNGIQIKNAGIQLFLEMFHMWRSCHVSVI